MGVLDSLFVIGQIAVVIIIAIFILILIIFPLVWLWFKYKEKKLAKNIPEKVIKEVQNARKYAKEGISREQGVEGTEIFERATSRLPTPRADNHPTDVQPLSNEECIRDEGEPTEDNGESTEVKRRFKPVTF